MNEILLLWVYTWLLLNVVAIIITPFRTDWIKIKQDTKMIFKKNKILYTIFIFLIVLCVLPFSIPYTMKNISDRIK
jgi:hypothetical protein